MFSLYDHLAFRAKLNPDSVALQQLDSQLSFYQLFVLVKKIAHKLRGLGIRPGQLVVTSIPAGHIDWIVTLALVHEAAVTCSNHGYESLNNTLDYDWIITDQNADYFSTEKVILINESWLADAANQSHEIEHHQYASGDNIGRITLTSGTTGTRKAAA